MICLYFGRLARRTITRRASEIAEYTSKRNIRNQLNQNNLNLETPL